MGLQRILPLAINTIEQKFGDGFSWDEGVLICHLCDRRGEKLDP